MWSALGLPQSGLARRCHVKEAATKRRLFAILSKHLTGSWIE